jgi:hypothetical protein
MRSTKKQREFIKDMAEAGAIPLDALTIRDGSVRVKSRTPYNGKIGGDLRKEEASEIIEEQKGILDELEDDTFSSEDYAEWLEDDNLDEEEREMYLIEQFRLARFEDSHFS